MPNLIDYEDTTTFNNNKKVVKTRIVHSLLKKLFDSDGIVVANVFFCFLMTLLSRFGWSGYGAVLAEGFSGGPGLKKKPESV